MKIIALLLVCVFLSSCAQYYQSRVDTYHSYTRRYTFQVVSEPPGAKIEVNGNYIGDAPVYYSAECKLDPSLYSDYNIYMYNNVGLLITALPTEPGQYSQSKYIYIDPQKAETIPTKVFFDMRLQPVPRQYEIDVR